MPHDLLTNTLNNAHYLAFGARAENLYKQCRKLTHHIRTLTKMSRFSVTVVQQSQERLRELTKKADGLMVSGISLAEDLMVRHMA